jgi:fructose-bisphosphate aldolase class II
MPIVSTKEILGRAFRERYGVGAFNMVNDLTLEAVLAAASELKAPVIIQTSVKTVKSIGLNVLYALFREMASPLPIPVSLHLDHCPERELITACLQKGWNSVLFDGSHLAVKENRRQTIEVVAEAKAYGAQVEGEIEGIMGVEDGVGSDKASTVQSLDTALDFIRSTGVDIFAPYIGNAHGVYKAAPKLDVQRVSDIVAAVPIPIALHGGTGLLPEQFRDLIARGCAKINISTAVKISYMKANFAYLQEHPGKYDPPSLFRFVRSEVMAMAADHIRMFGSAGKAW